MILKRGQISAQIFIYIIAIILFSLILVYGYNAIRGFKDKSEQVAYIKFKTDLTSAVKRISSDYGTLKREELFIGGEFSKVCFVQSYKPESNSNLLGNIGDFLIKDSVEAGVEKDVFLFTTRLQDSFYVGKINVTGVTGDGYLCIPFIAGRARVQFEGKGDHTFISTW